MVYGLNAEKMNCERIFNLFCLYGNVVKVIPASEYMAIEQFSNDCRKSVRDHDCYA